MTLARPRVLATQAGLWSDPGARYLEQPATPAQDPGYRRAQWHGNVESAGQRACNQNASRGVKGIDVQKGNAGSRAGGRWIHRRESR